MVEIKSLEPRKKERRSLQLPARRESHPFSFMQREINRLFDDFFGYEPALFRTADEWYGGFSPQIDVTENEKEILVSAELPRMDEKDVEVLLSGDALTIKGEKKEEKEEKEKNYYRMERRYGSFQQTIPLPSEIDLKKVDATFKKGVLSVKLPKTEAAKGAAKKIPLKS